jgi:hypothetical protein
MTAALSRILKTKKRLSSNQIVVLSLLPLIIFILHVSLSLFFSVQAAPYGQIAFYLPTLDSSEPAAKTKLQIVIPQQGEKIVPQKEAEAVLFVVKPTTSLADVLEAAQEFDRSTQMAVVWDERDGK